jgi:nitroreductase
MMGSIVRAVFLRPIDLLLRPFPNARNRLADRKFALANGLKLRYFSDDVRRANRFMVWMPRDDGYDKLSAELLFYYHKLEKGLCLTDGSRFFGKAAALTTVALLKRWRSAGHPRSDRVYAGAVETLRSYRDTIAQMQLHGGESAKLVGLIDATLAGDPMVPELHTPMAFRPSVDMADAFEQLCLDRRSVRAYKPDPVDPPLIARAISIAQLSPSVCNRQAWHVHVYSNRDDIAHMLKLQNGNGGFGHQLSTLLVIAMDSTAFFDASERNQQFIDAGLFSMSLVLALQSLGLASCCLNWCVPPKYEDLAHRRGKIPDHHRIMMYMAVGHPADSALVPRSPRRELGKVVTNH